MDELLERGPELGDLAARVDRLVREGVGGTVLLLGEPGIGKSRLLRTAGDLARGAGVTTLAAHGSELEHELAFGGVRQLFGRHLDRRGEPPRPALQTAAHQAAAIATGVTLADRGDGDPLFALASLLAGLADEGPVALLIDDFQWLDEASARFTSYVARRTEGQPILALVAARDETGSEPVRDLLATGCNVIRPRPLSGDGVAELLGAITGTPTTWELARAARRATGGLPFLVEELARDLTTVPEQERVSAVQRLGPAAIGRAVVDRVRRLPEPALAVAEAVALFPDGARLADVAALTGLEAGRVSSAADALVAASVLGPEDTLAFAHPVMRTAFYQQLGTFRRRTGHVRVADLLQRRGAPVEEVAAHLLLSEPSANPGHVAVLVEAAAAAERAGALHAATRYLSRALEEPPVATERAELAHRVGRLQAAIGAPQADATLRRALDQTTDPDQRANITLDLAALAYATSRYDLAVETLLTVRQVQPPLDRERALIVDALVAGAAWNSRRYRHLYASVADALPEDLGGETPGERFALSLIGARMFDRCLPHERVVSVLERAIGETKVPFAIADLNLSDPISILLASGALERAGDLATRLADDARATGRDAWYVTSQVLLARIAWLRGDIRECEATLTLALELPGALPGHLQMLTAHLAVLRIAQGNLDDAERLMEEASTFGVIPATGDRRRGQIAAARGRWDEAVGPLEAAWRDLEAVGSLNPSEAVWLPDLAEALSAVGRTAEALALAHTYLERAVSFGEARAIGLGHRTLGRLHPGESGIGHLQRAVAVLDASPYRYDAARANLDLGAALRRTNRRVDAREHLRPVLAYATQEQVQPLIRLARDELAASGARPRRTALVGVDALTPSEARIARLASSGMTNREIATHLFLTVKTVEMHLGRAFGKLGVASRRELATALPDGA